MTPIIILMIMLVAEPTRSQNMLAPRKTPSSLHQPPSDPVSYQEEVLQLRKVDSQGAFQFVPPKLQCVKADQLLRVQTCHHADLVP